MPKTPASPAHREARPRGRSPTCRSTAAAACASACFRQQAEQRQREAGDRAGIAGLGAMDFGQRGLGQAAAQRLVERADTGGRKQSSAAGDAVAAQHDAVGRAGCRGASSRSASRAFDPRNFLAQGKNSLPRHGVRRHDGLLSRQLFLLCSYRFQSRPEESSRVEKNLFLCLEASARPRHRLARKGLESRAAKAICRQKDNAWPASTRPAPGTTSFRPRSRNRAAGAGSLCPSAGGFPQADRRDRHPDRRIPDRRDHGRPVAGDAVRPARPVRGPRHRRALEPGRPARGRTASRSTAAPSSTTGPKTRRRWATSSPMC